MLDACFGFGFQAVQGLIGLINKVLCTFAGALVGLLPRSKTLGLYARGLTLQGYALADTDPKKLHFNVHSLSRSVGSESVDLEPSFEAKFPLHKSHLIRRNSREFGLRRADQCSGC